MVGLCEVISVVFMIWAIVRIYLQSMNSMTIKQLVSQREIIVHVITMFLYLGSVIVHLVYYARWKKYQDTINEKKVYVSFAIVDITLMIV